MTLPTLHCLVPSPTYPQILDSPSANYTGTDVDVKYPVIQGNSSIRVHYTGSLLDGTVFDSSEGPGRAPVEFTLGGQLIPCWNIGISTHRAGDVLYLTCSSKYGYGEQGSPPKIPGGATLKFKVSVLAVLDSKQQEVGVNVDGGAREEL